MASLRHKKNLGQNFLKSKDIAEEIVSFLDIQEGDSVLEIGPGEGVLTRHLLEKEIPLVAIEKDKRLIPALTALSNRDNFKVLNESILGFSLEKLGNPSEKIKIVGNIPYNITSEIIFFLIENRDRIKKAVLTVQKEVAERLAATPKNKAYGRITVMLQLFASVHSCRDIDRTQFDPEPKVDSSVIEINFHDPFPFENLDLDLFEKVVKVSFGAKRKKLSNNLKGFRGVTSDDLLELGFSSNARAEELSIDDFVKLTQMIKEK